MFKISALGGYYGLHTRPESAENVGKVTQKLCNGVNCLFFWPRFRPWDQVPLIMAKPVQFGPLPEEVHPCPIAKRN